MQAIETVYKGYRFRSRLEARWAVFFDAMGIEWEYEPEGFELDDGTMYLPDFYLHINRRMVGEPQERKGCWVEVKGDMTDEDMHKIVMFASQYPIIVLGNIPSDIWDYTGQSGYLYSYRWIDGDDYTALFSKVDGVPWIAGMDHDEWDGGDLMNKALQKARQARFEHGETPDIKQHTFSINHFNAWPKMSLRELAREIANAES